MFRRVTRTGAISSTADRTIRRAHRQETPRATAHDPREFADGHQPPTQIAATTRHQDQRVLAGYIRAGRGKDDIAHVL
jgi:hypothetical protein